MAQSSPVDRPTYSCENCCGYRFCLLSRLNRELRDTLSSQLSQQRLLRKGEKLYTPGSDFDGLYIIKSGSFKSAYSDTSGDQQVIGFYFPTQLLGIDGIESQAYRYDVEALETSTVCPLPYPRSGSWSEAMKVELLQQILVESSRQSFQDSCWLLVVGRLKADQRLARFLLTLSQQMEMLGRSGREFPLTMPRHDIANHLGIANETVSRLFKRFEDNGWIFARRRWVQISNRAALLELLENENTPPLLPVSGIPKTTAYAALTPRIGDAGKPPSQQARQRI